MVGFDWLLLLFFFKDEWLFTMLQKFLFFSVNSLLRYYEIIK